MNPLYLKALQTLATNPEIVGEFLEQLDSPMPNIEMQTMGGKFFWKELASFHGWKLQENTVFGNCRILNPDDVRIAWGGKSAMERAFERILN
jgi:hypothetical protein